MLQDADFFDLWQDRQVCLTCSQLDDDLVCDRSGEAVLEPWATNCPEYQKEVNEE